MHVLDVLVVGKGPSGLVAAAELADAGLAVGVLAPPGPVRWLPEYGAWLDELRRIGHEEIAGPTWAQSEVAFVRGERLPLNRAYARIDKDRLAGILLERCEAGGVRWIDGRAAAVDHGETRSVVRCRRGGEVAARVVIDCSGHRPALLARAHRPAQGFQTALGWIIDYDGPLLREGHALFMDWDDGWLPARARAASPPSFLYAMPLGGGQLFVEETVLVGRPAVPLPRLRERLLLRLASLGVDASSRRAEERCWIPMGGPLPDLRQRTLGFGAAAGMVHPASGYLLTRVLETAPRLAATLVQELGAPGANPERTSAAAWEAIWPEQRRHTRDLYCFGMEVLLRLTPHETRSFFRSFFELPAADWQGYLDDGLTAAQLRGIMGRVFLNLPGSLQRRLAGTALGGPGIRLARSLLHQMVA